MGFLGGLGVRVTDWPPARHRARRQPRRRLDPIERGRQRTAEDQHTHEPVQPTARLAFQSNLPSAASFMPSFECAGSEAGRLRRPAARCPGRQFLEDAVSCGARRLGRGPQRLGRRPARPEDRDEDRKQPCVLRTGARRAEGRQLPQTLGDVAGAPGTRQATCSALRRRPTASCASMWRSRAARGCTLSCGTRCGARACGDAE